jgi:hypothetical protein
MVQTVQSWAASYLPLQNTDLPKKQWVLTLCLAPWRCFEACLHLLQANWPEIPDCAKELFVAALH